MTGILSKPVPPFDISSSSFRGAARDLGELLAYLAGGIRPDPDAVSRLFVSMRQLRGFLIQEAEDAAGREMLDQLIKSVDLSAVPLGPDEIKVTFL